jgi:hypothetical protein
MGGHNPRDVSGGKFKGGVARDLDPSSAIHRLVTLLSHSARKDRGRGHDRHAPTTERLTLP